MTGLLSKIETNYNLLNKNYKIFVIASLFGMVFVIWYMMMSTLLNKMAINKGNLVKIKQGNVILKKQVEILTSKAVVDKTLEYKQKELNLQKKYNALKKEASGFQFQTMLPDEVLPRLNKILRTTSGVRLLLLHYLPEEKVKNAMQNSVKRLPVEIKVEGDFFSLLNYLKKIEHDHSFIFWEEIDYKVIDYPNAVVKLKLYVITTDAG